MEYSPPPLFKQGASARFKMIVFACISIALLVIDARFDALSAVRKAAATALYPFQMAALVPRDIGSRMGAYFSSIAALEKELQELKRQQIAVAQTVQQSQRQVVENNHLRKLMDARDRIPVKSILGEILYEARDFFTRKIVLDRGSREGVVPGLPVIDSLGVVGQVTRVFPFTSEVTLLTDTEQAISVQVLRNGLRSVAYGRGQSGLLDLRFVAPNADIQVGDVLVTSGIDGVYPGGLAVARVVQVENSATGAFGHVVCRPLAGIDNNTQLLILMSAPDLLPRPPEAKANVKRAGKAALPVATKAPPAPAPQPKESAP
ncbi:MAG: rod shape-determining protein MreC [Janthinobacterium sp.]|jgi:rod shape-determining protein MreC